MASWKEKGFVPDSDEEGSLDSDNDAATADHEHELLSDEHNGIAGKDSRVDHPEGLVTGTTVPESAPVDEGSNHEEPSLPPHTKALSHPEVVERRLFLSSSPRSPQTFKVPGALWDLDPETRGSELTLSSPLPFVDDISTSYVRLTSPVESLLSSPTAIQQEPASNPHLDIPQGQKTVNTRVVEHASIENGLMTEHTTSSTFAEIGTSHKREFRRRAPIQLHPYAMEQEKYRQSLRARGLRPMRLTQTRDDGDVTGEVSSPAPESQDAEMQVMDQDTEESQLMDFSWDLEPSQPPLDEQERVQSSQRSGASASTDDGEFPDIDELLRRPGNLPPTSKRRMRVYSSKSKRPRLSKLPTLGDEVAKSDRSTSVFDVPASPPATSFPFLTMARSIHPSASRPISVSSKELTPSWLGQDELASPTAQDLSTPPTSVIKPVSDPISLESDLDDDPFVSAPNSSTASSSDESIQVHKIGKKIRGVLPASHLRLDQQIRRQMPANYAQRDNLTASPQRASIRRGVALPKVPGRTQAASSSTNQEVNFFSDESEDEEETGLRETVARDENADPDGVYPASRRGYAEEEDRIDAMLPTGQRQRQRHFNAKARKKMKMSSTSLPTYGYGVQTYQPKITQHLVTHASSRNHPNQTARKAKAPKRFNKGALTKSIRPTPPRLSILDVTEFDDRTTSSTPQFIRIASRTARSQVGHGRQSPSKKFIRLASREDTVDAQSVLEDWRNGKIKPKSLESLLFESVDGTRTPLGRIANNRQMRLQPPQSKGQPRSQASKASLNGPKPVLPRQLVVSKGQQISINNFVSVKPPAPLQPHSRVVADIRSSRPVTQRRPVNPRSRAPQARPAQLESSEVEYSRQNPVAAFTTTKKALDSVFRVSRKLTVEQKNLQLNRFLADDDLVRPSIEVNSLPVPEISVAKTSSNEPIKTNFKQRKRVPQRIDASAARYRQPSEAMIVDLVGPSEVEETPGNGSKLMGLGKFGVRYPTHFDILPLQSGIFFHESTFIGSGRLSEAFKVVTVVTSDPTRSYASFRLGDMDFCWGPWDGDVSSQVGLVFDFMLEQLHNSSGTSSPDSSRLMTSIVDYVQHHLSFGSSEGRAEFLIRMFEAVQDFTSRIAAIDLSSDPQKAQPRIDVMARCTVLAMQLLRISRVEQCTTTFQLEDLLKSAASACVRLCLHEGLDAIRKLYDDLQYLSIRERGIKGDQYAAHAWVVVLRVLGAAQISKGSFWDVTNMALLDLDEDIVDDARVMEKMWYSIFSLLPLSEFDEYGVIIPGLRHIIPFDNWSLPQRLLKRVFALYSSDARQSPSFNDYCRALVSRCHFLLCEWGWWKSTGLVGTLFDFFASQKLSHLRNEEVYKSPGFLEDLDARPSLAVEPEDRCFHIFLKIAALCIKHLRSVGDLKSIRNLVARLLPNHNRQYPKDEDIHQRQLAALRNHHDLLCMLYWSSPRDARPSLNLIQELVSADQSHKEACLINIRAWGNLARYIFTSSENETTSYQQFADWQNAFFDKLLHQYLHKETDVRREADSLPDSDKTTITEAQLTETVAADRRSTMATIQALIYNLEHNVKTTRNPNSTMIALNHEILCKILTPTIFGVYRDIDQNLVCSAIRALQSYMGRIDTFHPLAAPQSIHSDAELDSQQSLEYAYMNAERQTMINPLHEFILPNLTAITREILECRLYQPTEPIFMRDLISCWAHLVSLVTEEKFVGYPNKLNALTELTRDQELKEFVTSGPNAVFENHQRSPRAGKYWPLFLDLLLMHKGIDGLKVPGFDLGTEWMQVVTKPPTFLTYEASLSRRLLQDGHYLLKSTPELGGWDWLSPAYEWPARHRDMFNAALNSMQKIIVDPTYGGFTDSQRLSGRETQALFSVALKRTMDSMQHHLESMIPQSASHLEYVGFCQNAARLFRAFTNTIRPLSDFFVRCSINYWPKEDDPHMYGAGILSYSLRLNDHSSKTYLELFYYLYSGWKNDQMHSRLESHITCVQKGTKDWAFTDFMLTNFIPATVVVGFNTAGGIILTKTYLPMLAKRIPHYLQRNGPRGATIFTHTITILKMIINGVFVRAVNAHARRSLGPQAHWAHAIEDTILGVHPEHRGILSIVCQFYIAIRPALLDYVAKFQELAPALDEVSILLTEFFRKAVLPREQQDISWVVKHLEVSHGEYVDRFVTALQEDIEKSWVVERRGDSVVIKSGPTSTQVSLVEGVSRLEDVLKLGMCFLDGFGPESLVRPTDYMGDGKAFPGVIPPIF